jgi:NAD(P)-dependent dehydrogenase (short-subunit alcohol dehydrogenase family)
MTKAQVTRRVLITGTSSGFGHGAAQALAARGHTVLATMRGVSGKNRGTADALRAWADEGGHTVHVIELDVTDEASVKAGVTRALELGGGIDTVINNVGTGTFGIQEAFSPVQLTALFDVNVVGALRVNQVVLPLMREAGAGHVVFVSSGLGRLVLPFLGPYTATKFALEGLAENLALEVAPLGIDVTIIQPGTFATPFGEHSMLPTDAGLIDRYGPVKAGFEAFLAGFQERFASGQVGDPQEVHDAFVRVVEMPKGERPLRVTVGKDVEQGVGAINQTCAQVQDAMLRAMGMKP